MVEDERRGIPYAVSNPDKLKSVSFMIKDAKRFAETGGWGYAQFKYDAAADRFKPTGTGSGCGYACHTRVKSRDFVFTGMPSDDPRNKVRPGSRRRLT
jgi:Cytochrome P460